MMICRLFSKMLCVNSKCCGDSGRRHILSWVSSMRAAAFVIFIAMQASALAADYKPLVGQYSVGGKTLYDPPDDEPKGTHMYVMLAGATAKDLFVAMRVPAVRDVCRNDGSLTKRVKEMRCTRSVNGKEYTCWFGIDVKNQRITNGVVC